MCIYVVYKKLILLKVKIFCMVSLHFSKFWYFDIHSAGVSWRVIRSLCVTCSLVFADPTGRLCLLEGTIKVKAFWFMGDFTSIDSRDKFDFLLYLSLVVCIHKITINSGRKMSRKPLRSTLSDEEAAVRLSRNKCPFLTPELKFWPLWNLVVVERYYSNC